MTEDVISDFERNYERKKIPSWIIGDNTLGTYGCKCLRCGQKDEMPSQVTITEYIHRVTQFAQVHKDCHGSHGEG